MSWHAKLHTRVGTLSLEAELGGADEPVVLVGPNGAGKTTVLRLLVGAAQPERGTITVGSRTIVDTDQGICLPPEHRKIGYVPQGYGLFPHLSALDNVAFGLRFSARPLPRPERRDKARSMLARLGCEHVARREVTALSGGERQRVALARALVVEPELLLLDEPLSALDAATRRGVRTFLVEHLRSEGRPAIVVTHDLRDVRALGAEVFVLEAGQIVQRGTAQELAAQPATPFVAELFDAPGEASGVR